ncbi:energy-coupling factor transporter transmembrane component T, partial [Salmonella enterica]
TSVSEFIAAMDRMHITKKLSVPISVMFRFFPTIKEEYRNVQDAMKLRGVGSVRDPMKMLEYRMVPFLMSVVSIGNDLSASALTRALNSP